MKEPDKYTAADVFDLIGIKYPNRKNAKVVCPKCGKQDFYMNMERNFGRCVRASCEYHGNQLTYYADSLGISTKEAHTLLLKYKGYGDATTIPTPPKRMEFGKEMNIAPIERRNSIYNVLYSHLPLLKYNRDDLYRRGIKDSEMDKFPYLTYFFKDEAAYDIANHCGNVSGIPGFYKDEKGWRLRYLKRGVLIPFKDNANQIQGFQLRKDHVNKEKNEKKCNWLSSSGLEQGTAIVGGLCHYACDFYFDFSLNRELPYLGPIVLLTEGGMKADIIHLLTNLPVIAVAGVNSLEGFSKELPFLKKNGVKEIVNAYDMDYLTNPDVFAAIEKVESIIKGNDFRYSRITWDINKNGKNNLKGYDDFLMWCKRNVNPQ